MTRTTTRARRAVALALAGSISFAGMMHGAQAALIGTEQVASAQTQAATSSGHARLNATLERADVVAALQERGVSIDAAKQRVAALTDSEAAQLAAQIDQAPAGADSVLGVIVTIFVVLLITDILGFTKIFPFTRSIR
jgi:hypothetical protein